MSNANFCWFCSHPLVGAGGVPHKEPLIFRLIKTHDGYEVRVHVRCEEFAKRHDQFMKKITAQPNVRGKYRE
jgi:hypothetical protein